MDIFVARQPIFDRRSELVAYELLYRSGLHNAMPAGMDVNAASAHVISEALTAFGYEALLDGRIGYFNAADQVLREGWYRVLPSARTVVEVLETVTVTPEILAACQAVKLGGYRLALDDFVYRPDLQPLLDLADIVKIDFQQVGPDDRALAREQVGSRALVLAEKVETPADFRSAVHAGYDLFQGYFFARPEIVARKDIAPGKLAFLQLLKELNQPALDFPAIEAAIKHDPALSLKLLRFLNSAAFGWRSRVESLKQALVLLGERPFRRWVSLLAVSVLAADKPMPLLMTCMVRARFAENLAVAAKHAERALDAFFAGIISSLDVLMGRPLHEILAELKLSPEMRAALLGEGEGTLSQLLGLATGYEQGQWPGVQQRALALTLAEDAVAAGYREALVWARQCWPESL